MADEIKKEETNTVKAQSTIKKIKDPDFSKEVTIDRLVADKQAVDFHFNRMKKEFGDKLSDEDIRKRIHNMVVRDNIFNAAMHIIVPCYEIKIDPKDLQNIIDSFIKGDPRLGKAPYEYVKTMATRLMEKEMLFAVLAKEWNISVDDKELRDALDAYYKETNHPIRDILNDNKRMEAIRKTILDQKIANTICSKLKFKMDNEAIMKNAEASRKAMEEALAKAKANTKVTDETKK
ncbi:MAG: hypothetical protein KBS35_00600 [Mycoplasma sp.]|nr:hypothetical protein [Candidatus Hennigella equi]